MSDPVKAPIHYEGDGETTCKVALRSMMSKTAFMGDVAYWWGCAFKYVWRWPHKGKPIRDIDKAIECLNELKKAL